MNDFFFRISEMSYGKFITRNATEVIEEIRYKMIENNTKKPMKSLIRS